VKRRTVVAVLGGAIASAQAPPRQMPPGVRMYGDLVYAHRNGRPLLLDLYVPKTVESKPPLVVWIHGGAWRAGNKRNTPALYLTGQGFAVASIAYRFSQEAIFPAQFDDMKAALDWLRSHAGEYGIDARRIGVWGASAGAHLAALAGTREEAQAVVDFYGPTDLPQMSKFLSKIDHDAPDSPESQLVGGPLQQNRDKADLANPIRYIDGKEPPFLIVHGDSDSSVPLNQSELLQTALEKAGVPVEFVVLKGAGHGGPQFNTPELRDRIAGFFDQHLRR
jgi:acetyl esterase/lipase